MGKAQRTKGHGFERDIAKRLREIFPNASRKLEYQAEACSGVDIAGTGVFKAQCKRYKGYAPISKLEEIREPGIHALITKADHKPTVIALYFDDFMRIVKDIGELYADSNKDE